MIVTNEALLMRSAKCEMRNDASIVSNEGLIGVRGGLFDDHDDEQSCFKAPPVAAQCARRSERPCKVIPTPIAMNENVPQI